MAAIHAALSLVLLAGSIVMIFFVILSAVTTMAPLNNTWFLQADTSGIEGARPITQWTYFYFCGEGNTDCSKAYADPAFGLAWMANASGAPAELLGPHGGGTTSTYYFYMWRFGWVFYIISLFFAVAAFFTGFLACFGRLGGAVSGFVASVALFFYTFAVALMTTTFVKARNAFIANGQDAVIGKAAFGFSWGAWMALLLASVLFCLGVRVEGRGVKRSRSTRSRASVEVNGRRVKDDYS